MVKVLFLYTFLFKFPQIKSHSSQDQRICEARVLCWLFRSETLHTGLSAMCCSIILRQAPCLLGYQRLKNRFSILLIYEYEFMACGKETSGQSFTMHLQHTAPLCHIMALCE
jgi:hypothetical protein